MSYVHTIHRLHEMRLLNRYPNVKGDNNLSVSGEEPLILRDECYLCQYAGGTVHYPKCKKHENQSKANSSHCPSFEPVVSVYTLYEGDDNLTDIGYENIIKRILSDTVEMPDYVGKMTSSDLTLYLNGYATAQKRIVQMIRELSEGPGDR